MDYDKRRKEMLIFTLMAAIAFGAVFVVAAFDL